MKKTYMRPAIRCVGMDETTGILAGSNPVMQDQKDGTVTQTTTGVTGTASTDDALAKPHTFNLWEGEE